MYKCVFVNETCLIGQIKQDSKWSTMYGKWILILKPRQSHLDDPNVSQSIYIIYAKLKWWKNLIFPQKPCTIKDCKKDTSSGYNI